MKLIKTIRYTDLKIIKPGTSEWKKTLKSSTSPISNDIKENSIEIDLTPVITWKNTKIQYITNFQWHQGKLNRDRSYSSYYQ